MWVTLCTVLTFGTLVVKGHGDLSFGAKFYEVLRQQPGNILISPASLQLTLGLAWLGARGTTECQISTGLGLVNEKERAQLGLKSLLNTLQGDESQTIQITNQMFIDRALPVKEEFRTSAASILRASAEPVDFNLNPEDARNKINYWVQTHTDGKIRELFSKGTITSGTSLVLANAVYFKAPWDRKFKSNRTRTKSFYTEFGTSVPVQMMTADGIFKYAYLKNVDAKIIQLPYKGLRTSMIVILPAKKTGLAQLEMGLATLDIDRIIDELEADDDPLYLELPRFKLEYKSDLTSLIKKLGMSEMFENGADFSGLTNNPVKVSRLVQSSIVETNEEGSEAAAASGSEFVNYSSPTTFIADHPFIFLIRDDASGTVLFIGRFSAPS